jgi:hypothetical protein
MRPTVPLLVMALLGALTGARAEAPRPALGPMSAMQRWQVLTALDLALERLEERSPCRALFDSLGADGAAVMARTELRLPDSAALVRTCRQRRALALTAVGGRTIWLCPSFFRRTPRHRAAATLVHEALHQAGLGERPTDPVAPTPREIDLAVARSCRF